MNSIKIGACDWALPGAGLYAVRIAAEYGLQALSLKIGLYENNYPIAEKPMQRCYLEDQQRYGVEYCAIALNDFDNIPMHAREGTPSHEQARTILNKGVQTARALQVPVIQVPGFAASEVRSEEDYEYAARAFRYLCDEAGDIHVASESLLQPEEFKKLYDLVDRENFGAYYDSQNYHLFRGYDQVEILNGLRPYMVDQLHVKDGNGAMSGALLGTGNSNFSGTMRVLAETGYEGYILLENYYDRLPLRLAGEDPYQLLAQDTEILKAAIKNR